MRDEARSKRLASLVCLETYRNHFRLISKQAKPFSLQADTEKISQYWQELKQRDSWAAYPNILAAKWRQIYTESDAQRKEGPSTGMGGVWLPPTYHLDEQGVYHPREMPRQPAL
jgi:hypothetical protein